MKKAGNKMNIEIKKVYSEVNSILDMLGENYINKIPSSLYKTIQGEKLDEYNPKYTSNVLLVQQNIKKETLSIIALIHLHYWCNSNEEKENIIKIFNDNEIEYQKKIREKYNPDNLFKDNNIKTNIEKIEEDNDLEKQVAMVEYKNENFFMKIINRLKKIFLKDK
jgi:glutamyl/glutaminyl-tRNA synthetase